MSLILQYKATGNNLFSCISEVKFNGIEPLHLNVMQNCMIFFSNEALPRCDVTQKQNDGVDCLRDLPRIALMHQSPNLVATDHYVHN